LCVDFAAVGIGRHQIVGMPDGNILTIDLGLPHIDDRTGKNRMNGRSLSRRNINTGMENPFYP
jgi:hypothetical protein